VVVTRDKYLKIEGCLIAHSLPEAIRLCAGSKDVFIVGGADIYAQSLDLADTLYLTEIQQNIDGDAHFPNFDLSLWQETSREILSQLTPQPLEFHFVTFHRR
jgi:dihydrofolate reductase